jgi:transketolase
MKSVMIDGRYPGQSPRTWDEDYEGMQALFDACLLGAYAVCRKFRGGVHAAAIGASSHVLTVLLGRHALWDLGNPWAAFNDTVLYSNGHGPEVLFQLLWRLFPEHVPEDWVKNRCVVGGSPSHPEGRWRRGVPDSVLPYRGMSADLGGDAARAPGLALMDLLQAGRDTRNGGTGHVPHVWVILSDGCVAEPETWGAIETIGQRRFPNVTFLVVDNLASLAGYTSRRYKFQSSTVPRAAASGWATYQCTGHYMEELDEAFTAARGDESPSLIWTRTLSAYGLPDERKARTHGASITPGDFRHVMERFGRAPDSDPFAVGDALSKFLARRRQDIAADVESLERRVPGIAAVPSFGMGATDALAEAIRRLSDPADHELRSFTPRDFLRDRVLPRAEALCRHRGETLIYVSPDIGTSTGVERGTPIVPSGDDPEARVLDLGANEAGAAHVAEALNSQPHRGVLAVESTFLCYHSRTVAAVNNALRRGLPYRAVRSHADKGLGTDGPTHYADTEVHRMRLGQDQYEYLCATPEELVFGMARLLSATEGAHFVVYPRQTLPVPERGKGFGQGRLLDGVYPYRQYGPGRPEVYVVGSGMGLSMGANLCAALAEGEGVSSLLLSGFSISLFHRLAWSKRTEIIPEGSSVVWIDPTETSNPDVAGMLNTLPSRMLHAGVKSLYFPCLAPDDPELWKFDGLDTPSLVERTLRLIRGTGGGDVPPSAPGIEGETSGHPTSSGIGVPLSIR